MRKIYQRFILLLLLLVLISGGVIYFTVDINTLENFHSFETWSLEMALFMLSIGLLLDGTRLMHLVRISNEKISFHQTMQVVFGNYFLALLTPGATGGAVAQLLFLRHAGVPTGKATLIVIVRTLLSILFLFLCLPFIFLYDTALLPWIPDQALALFACVLLVCILLGIWAVRTRFLDYLVVRLAKRLSHPRRRFLLAFYRDIKGAVFLLSAAPVTMIRISIESGASLLCIYSVVPFLIAGLGVEADWATIMGRMIFLNLLLYFAPTPGGSGVAEGGFVLLFNEFLPSGTVGILAVVWRMIVEYLPFMIGFVYTLRVFGRDFLSKQLAK